MKEEEVVPGLAETVEARRLELGLTVGQLISAAGLTGPGLAPLRKGYRRRYSDKLKLGVTAALGWTPDSIDRMLRGDPPLERRPHPRLFQYWSIDAPRQHVTITRPDGTTSHASIYDDEAMFTIFQELGPEQAAELERTIDRTFPQERQLHVASRAHPDLDELRRLSPARYRKAMEVFASELEAAKRDAGLG